MPAEEAPSPADERASVCEGNGPLQFGKYQLLRLLARGGMGEVYLARLVGELGFEKQLVIKTILPEFAAEPHFIELFAEEAKTTVNLSHGNIVPTYELGRVHDTFYIVMGYVDGPSVAQLLTSWHRAKRPPSIEVALHILRGVLTGLAYAHRDEPGRPAVVHRDISPRNVLLERSGQVRIVDFGISARARAQVNMRAGSVGYMAPEQARGEAADPRADVFSAACLLYALVTGDCPFPKEGVWSQPNLALLPEDLRDPMAQALSLKPSGRPADAGAFLRLLGPALAKYVPTYGDPELSAHLAEVFPHGWRTGSAPASAGNTRLFDGPGQTFVTRLTAITSVPAPAAENPSEDFTPLPFAAEEEDDKSTRTHARPWPRRSLWLAAASLLVGGVGLGMSIARHDDAPAMRTWAALGPAALRVAERSLPDDEHNGALRRHLVHVEPPDAVLELDGEPVAGENPYELRVRADELHRLTVHRDGYAPQAFELGADASWPSHVILEQALDPPSRLRTKEGYLRVLAPTVAWAEVVIDGRSSGHTPTRNLALPPGRHRVEVRCIPDACPTPTILADTQVVIEPEQTVTVDASPSVSVGVIDEEHPPEPANEGEDTAAAP